MSLLGRLSRSNTSLNSFQSSGGGGDVYRYSRQGKVVRTLFLIISSYVLTTFPFAVSILFECFLQDTHSETTPDLTLSYYDIKSPMYLLSLASVFIRVLTTPAVYVYTNKKLKASILTTLRIRKAQQREGSGGRLVRRWSLSSHIFDYVPARRPSYPDTTSRNSRHTSRRASNDSGTDTELPNINTM